MELGIEGANGRENRACLGRRVIGEASVPGEATGRRRGDEAPLYVSEAISRGQRQAKVCSARASYFKKPS